MHINILAAIAAGVVGYFPGALWYSPLMFLKRWAAELGISLDSPPKGAGQKIATGMVISIVSAIVFALIAGPAPGLHHALLLGLAVAGLIGSAFAIQYLYEGRSLAFWAINAGFHLVQFLLFGLVIGLWA